MTPNDEPRDPLAPEQTPRVDGAESIWDPWLISMYIDAVRTIESREPRRLH